MNIEIIESFFEDLSDYMKFVLGSQKRTLVTNDASCIATLEKMDDKYLYMLGKNGKSLAEFVRPFRADEQHLRLFNAGCAEMARRMRIYLETGDADQVPRTPPVFGVLSCESPEEQMPPVEVVDHSAPKPKYFPVVSDARVVRRFDGEAYEVLLLTDVKCLGLIRCTHLLVALLKGEKNPSYVVAAEVNNSRSPGDDMGSHFLGSYPGSAHVNHGCSNEWADLDRFDTKARELMAEALGITIS